MSFVSQVKAKAIEESEPYLTTKESAFYSPLFKTPVHLSRLTVAQLVMFYHSTTEWQFE